MMAGANRANALRTRFLFWLVLLLSPYSSASGFDLNDQCPPSFALSSDNQCQLRNLYQLYDSLQGQGLGGLKTALPHHRDGFSPQQIDLGRLLFFDPVLSGNKDLSCANCHNPAKGFSDGMARSVGASGQLHPRSAPTLWNSAFLKSLLWDARADSLEQQALGPLFSELEMANTPEQLMANLNQVDAYPELFTQAFPNSEDAMVIANITTALTAFQSSLISLNSPYDRYAHGDSKALNPEQLEGLNVFRSFVARCSQCHTPPLFTNQQVAVIGTPEPEGMPRDIGAQATFGAERLRGGFKVPTLRNIALTAPYMHSGRFATLREATEFYTKGRGHAVPEGEELLLHWHISEPNLTPSELDRLVDFMGALSDESFMPEIPQQVPSGLLH
ncbi:MAG: cytochrome-c peroxidase [Porticoccaceae bacterium]|jgi:cytochrome c peroxidase|nr:cytochrome-c peroxidase [Porticoccaceae bacterium]